MVTKEKKIQLTIIRLRSDLGRMPLPEEVCVEVGISMDRLEKAFYFYYLLLNYEYEKN